jgi:BRCT domain type II-containing protein
MDPDVIMSHIESVLRGSTDNVCPVTVRTLSTTMDVKHVVEQQCFTVSDESTVRSRSSFISERVLYVPFEYDLLSFVGSS